MTSNKDKSIQKIEKLVSYAKKQIDWLIDLYIKDMAPGGEICIPEKGLVISGDGLPSAYRDNIIKRLREIYQEEGCNMRWEYGEGLLPRSKGKFCWRVKISTQGKEQNAN